MAPSPTPQSLHLARAHHALDQARAPTMGYRAATMGSQLQGTASAGADLSGAGVQVKPSSSDMWLAAQWLEVYEGAEDAEACKRVAEWLRKQSDAADFRKACKDAGVPVSKARAALRRKAAT